MRDALASADLGVFSLGTRAANAIGMDAFDLVAPRATAAPTDKDSWWALMQCATDENIDRVVALAAQLLPLDEIATGPADEPDHEYTALDEILQELHQFPGKGWPLLATALRSPSVTSRRAVFETLHAWDRDQWPPEAEPAVRGALAVEPTDDLRHQITTLLIRRPLALTAHLGVRAESTACTGAAKGPFAGYESLTCIVSISAWFDLHKHPRLVPVGSDHS